MTPPQTTAFTPLPLVAAVADHGPRAPSAWARVDRYGRWAIAVVAVGVSLRVAGLMAGVPVTNSDEATMGLMARHIVTENQYPVFYYGQEYMGALEAYLAAPLFWLFDSSTGLLRTQTIGWFLLMCWATYRLSTRLCGKRIGLISLVLLVAVSHRVIQDEMRVGGGYPEIAPFAALLMLGAVHLAQTTTGAQRPGMARLTMFAGWGFIAGLALWDHWIVVPYLAVAGLLLVLFCARELLAGAMVPLALGAMLGSSPLLWLNLTGETNSLAVFRDMTKSHGVLPGIDHLYGGVLSGVPLTSGLCPAQCSPAQYWWGIAYVLVLMGAGTLALISLLALRPSWSRPAARAAIVRHAGRAALVVAGGITIYSFARSPAAAATPVESARYLALLGVSTPAVVWPVFAAARIVGSFAARAVPAVRMLQVALGTATVALLVTATVATFLGAPAARANEAEREALTDALDELGVSHIYTDYWTCNRVAFATRERIQCAVLDEDLSPGRDRYRPYVRRVRAAEHVAYAFPAASDHRATFDAEVASVRADMVRLHAGGYVIYH